MNNVIKLFLLAIGMFTTTVFAEVNNNSKRVSAKCYVELLGGSKTITGADINVKKINSLKQTLPGRKIYVPGVKDKQTIYKVIECVASNGKFKNKLANRLYVELPR